MSGLCRVRRRPALLLTGGATVALAAPYGVVTVVEALAVEVGIEALLALAGIVLALVLEALLRLPDHMVLLTVPVGDASQHPGLLVRAGRVVVGQRGRGPPAPVLP
jgi:hypothetical protein